jgi:hypothetical protein
MIFKKSLTTTFLLVAANFANAFVLPNAKHTFTPTTSSGLSAYEGGFKDTNPDFAYVNPQPDLSSLEITGNLDNIDKITRMQKIFWPRFSWLAVPGDESSRLYILFAKDISRLGYDDSGRIWSLICPQRGMEVPVLGTVMLEVTVTGVRGWVDEASHSCAADVGTVGVLWIEPNDNPFAKMIKPLLNKYGFPFSKKNGAKTKGHAVGKPYEDYWPMRNGTDPLFFHPISTQHWDEAFSVYHLQVEIGKQVMTGTSIVDDFNTLLIKAFNLKSGNILKEGQKVAWNVWSSEPEDVDTDEWKAHAKKWFDSITVNHTYPTGKYDDMPTYFDGTPLKPLDDGDAIMSVLGELKEFVGKHGETIKGEVESLKEEKEEEHKLLVDLSKIGSFLKNNVFKKRRRHIKEE